MVAKYRRFFGESDSETMEIPVRRFFLMYSQIHKLEAEESLLQIRIVSQPYMDRKSDDGFIDGLKRVLGMEAQEKAVDLISSDDLTSWGIGRVYKNPAEDLSKAFHITKGEEG